MSIFGAIAKVGETVGNTVNSVMPSAKVSYTAPEQAPAVQPAPTAKYAIPGRNLSITDSDLGVLKPLLYGEISNRNAGKKELEARVIFNTALNRMQAYAGNGSQKSLSDVLSAPNQYQAYNGPQYLAYHNPPDDPSKAKKQQVDDIVQKFLNEMEGGKFDDVTEGSYYYKHNPNGTIEYDKSRPLFKSNLGLQ